MKTAQFSSLGLNVKLSVPSTTEEFDTNAKRAGACLDEAVNNVVYRGSLAEFRDVFLHGSKELGVDGIETVTKIERKTKVTGKNEKGEEKFAYDETEGDFFKRVCAEKNVKPESFQALADKVSAAIKFDASARERKPAGPKKLGEKYKTAAASLLKGTQVKRFVGDIKKILGLDLVVSGDAAKDTEAFGWAIKRYQDWKNEQDLVNLSK